MPPDSSHGTVKGSFRSSDSRLSSPESHSPPSHPQKCETQTSFCSKVTQTVSALDVAKTLIDYGMHPPTIYFPLIVHEALMLEPTETEDRETLDWAANVYRELYELGKKDPEYMHAAPHNTYIGRPDDVRATRSPIVRWTKA